MQFANKSLRGKTSGSQTIGGFFIPLRGLFHWQFAPYQKPFKCGFTALEKLP
jgi:hypothetical protein